MAIQLKRRRGRDSGDGELLLERDAEQELIQELLDDAAEERGGVLVIEGPAGAGKSRLVNLAGDLAHAGGHTVLVGQGAELERDFPFGIAIQLFEPWWLSADRTFRETIAGNGGAAAARLLNRAAAGAEGDDGYRTIHGLFRLAARVAASGDGRATIMLIDDVHWADSPSVRFLAYLAARAADLPIAMIVTTRTGEPTTDPQGLAALRAAAGPFLRRLKSLSAAAVDSMVATAFPTADKAFCAACLHVTDGNPFLLVELLEQIRTDGRPPDAATASRLDGLAPEAVLDAVVARLGSHPPEVGALARAASILGDGSPLRRVARLAGLGLNDAVKAADTLAHMHLLCPGEPLAFVHPLIRGAVVHSVSPLDRGLAHLRAARLLDEESAAPEAIAPHLLAAPAEADARSVAILRDAARTAMASGAAESAIRMLRRALTEGAPDTSADLLAELGEAEAATGLGDSVGRLAEAIDANRDPRRRAELALIQGRVLRRSGEPRRAAQVLKRSLSELGEEDSALSKDLSATFVSAASLVPELEHELGAEAGRLLAPSPHKLSPPEREALAHLTLHKALRGGPQKTIRRVADLAWGDGRLLEDEAGSEASWPLICRALFMADELERDLELTEVALTHGARHGSEVDRAIANLCRAWPLYERGEIAAAAGSAQAAVDVITVSGPNFLRTAHAVIALCHLRRGELEHATTALAITEHRELRDSRQFPWLMLARAELRLAQRQPEAALNDATLAGRRWESLWGSTAGRTFPWRSVAAQAELALGRSTRAHELASQELADAESTDATRIAIRGQRLLGLAEGGRKGLDHLQSAAQLGASVPQRLEHVLTLIALGGALRRANQRAAAREPLLEAIKLAESGGATALSQRAHEELTATGVRLRTTARFGPDALTPSERRVAELAADGLTTRGIAESLFVTPKTVEFHLRHIYQKLGVNSRDRLAGALGATAKSA